MYAIACLKGFQWFLAQFIDFNGKPNKVLQGYEKRI